MGVVAPQWLLPAYVRSVTSLGASATAEQVRAAGEHLIEMWVSPDRRFHNLKHLIDMLARVDELADESHCPDVMRLATWYHGCVFSAATEQTYRRNGGEDKEASADYAREDLVGLGLPERVTERVCALIINLKRRDLPPGDIDALALNDADLGTLSVDPQEYKRYRELVREEYAHIPVGDYLRARLEIVSRLLARERLFRSPLGQRWEAAARENLEAERRRLLSELAAHDASTETPAVDRGMTQAAQPGPQPQAAQPGSRTLCSMGDLNLDPSLARPGRETPAALPSVPAGASPSAVVSAHSASTPAGPARVSPVPVARRSEPAAARPQPARVERPGKESDVRETSRTLEHATSMESCIEDLDALLGTKPNGAQEAVLDRQAQAESERLKMAERLRRKAEEAKSLREARTGEIAPIVEEIIDDGAGEL